MSTCMMRHHKHRAAAACNLHRKVSFLKKLIHKRHHKKKNTHDHGRGKILVQMSVMLNSENSVTFTDISRIFQA